MMGDDFSINVGGGGGGSIETNSNPRQLSKIEQEFESLQSQVNLLSELVSDLTNRLKPVLGEEYAVKAEGDETERDASSGSVLAATVRNVSRQVVQISNRVGTTIERLEI